MAPPPDPLPPVPPEPVPPETSPGQGPSELDGLDPAALLAGAKTPAGSAARTGQWAPPTVEEMIDVLPGYRILGLLGRGGMGAVYKGEQISLERRVAIKILPAELGSDPEFQARFRREAKSMARLNHPNIVQIYDFGQTAAGHCYFVMEFVDGTDLHRLIREGKLDVTGAINAVSQICDALQYAHDEGFVHRDIKPANIFLNRQGMLKVGDFGLAKLVEGGGDGPTPTDLANLTVSGVAMGTLNYIAPEQLEEGANVDHRADIYSLGVMFYEMLTREVPRGAVKEPSKRVAMLDVRIDGVVFKAMDPDPSERYQTAYELRSEVDVIRTTPAPEPLREQVPETAAEPEIPAASVVRVAMPRSARQPRRSPRRRSSPLPALWGAALLAAAGGLGWWFWPGRDRAVMEVPPPGGIAVAPPVVGPVTRDLGKATKGEPFANSLGMTFVPLPGTGLLMCRHETRKADYAAFAEAVGGRGESWKDPTVDGVPVSDKPDHPVVLVSWEDAVAFCEWLSRTEGRTYRLPTDREWSIAAQVADAEPAGLLPSELSTLRGAGDPDEAEGNFADLSWRRTLPNRTGGRNYDDTFPTTAPVMSFAPNALGLHDLLGNVWEHCQDYFDAVEDSRSLRGDCWNDTTPRWRSRTKRSETSRHPSDGFRCVLVVGEEAPVETPSVEFAAVGSPVRFGLSRYQFVYGASDWAQARAEAERRGGHLATFGTLAERDWARRQFAAVVSRDRAVWLGAHGARPDEPLDWGTVTREIFLPGLWTGVIGQVTTENPPHFHAALINNGNDLLSVSPIPATATNASGFLVEWEDCGGSPALAASGEAPDGPYTNSLGMKFLPVPGTDIQLCVHETRKSDYAAFAAENPGLANLWKTPPPHEGEPVSDGDDDPVVMVNWHEARAFCEWLGRKEGRSYRLPTDREWSVAAGIGDFEAAEGLPADFSETLANVTLFPWGINPEGVRDGAGNFFDKGAEARFKTGPRNSFWTYHDGHLTTAPVMSFPPNPLGFFDLHGNVSEMCEDAWGRGRSEWRTIGLGAAFCANRGGSWYEIAKGLGERGRATRDRRANDLGFRVALLVRAPEAPQARLSERTRPIGQPKRFGSSRYQWFEGDVTWGEARLRAEQMGGHLATLAFEAEAAWVAKEYGAVIDSPGSSLWIGMVFHTGRRWITREMAHYENWLESLPSDVRGGSALVNQAAAVLARSSDGKVGWSHRPLNGSGKDAPKGFLVEWDDIDGAPPLAAPVQTSREPFTNSLGMRFLPVEGADILLCVHETRRRDYAAFAKEAGKLDEGWVTPALDGAPAGHEDDHPVVMVNWHEARAFCDWLGRKEGRIYRLPTDREWSLAAGLGDLEDPMQPPDVLGRLRTDLRLWDGAWPPSAGAGNFGDASLKARLPNRSAISGYDDGFATTSPVMSFAPYRGLHDLAGNVSEWVEDRWPGTSRSRLLRGGSWFDLRDLAASRRIPDASGSRRFYFGFRCALAMAPEGARPKAASGADLAAAAPPVVPKPQSPVAEAKPPPAPAPAAPAKATPPFFLGRWYQTLEGKETPVYPSDFSADETVVATNPDGKRSTGRWRLSSNHLRIDWENGVSHLFELPVAAESLSLDGEAARAGQAKRSTVRLVRFQPGGGEMVLSDPSNQESWRVNGGGRIHFADGSITLSKTDASQGIAWFMKRTFGDFVLTAEYRLDQGGVDPARVNSGIFVRAPRPEGGSTAADRGYQIDVSGVAQGKEATGAICLIKAPEAYAQRPGWNGIEIEVRGQAYTVKVNGRVVNVFLGNRSASGYVGLQIYKPAGAEFRNFRIRELAPER